MSKIDEIQARADAATEGPWEAHLGHGAWMIQDDSCDDIATVHDRMGIDEDPQAEANAAFIINARSELPALVAALRAVEAVMASMDVDRANGHILTYGQVQRSVRTAIREALDG